MTGSIKRALLAHNGGPGLTAEELATQTGLPLALVRNALASLIFDEGIVTCTAEGRYKTGDPTPLINLKV